MAGGLEGLRVAVVELQSDLAKLMERRRERNRVLLETSTAVATAVLATQSEPRVDARCGASPLAAAGSTGTMSECRDFAVATSPQSDATERTLRTAEADSSLLDETDDEMPSLEAAPPKAADAARWRAAPEAALGMDFDSSDEDVVEPRLDAGDLNQCWGSGALRAALQSTKLEEAT